MCGAGGAGEREAAASAFCIEVSRYLFSALYTGNSAMSAKAWFHPEHRPHPEPPPMNTLQRTLCKILPRSWFAAIEAASRVWMVRCRCGLA